MEETFATALREVRLDRGLTQEGLADLAGLSAQAIGHLERGVRRFPHLTTLDKLDRALQFSAAERQLFRRLAARGTPTPAARSDRPGTSAWTVAQLLPTAIAEFTGRAAEVTRLTAALADPATTPGSPRTAVIRGMAGVGKTALAVQTAHAVADRYRDGILSVNLRGFSTPLSPLQAIGQLLRATGVPAEAVPDNVEEAAAALRSRLADRQVLLLLDNAHDLHQVSDLIPAAERSAVLITTRNTLTTLPANVHLHLEPLGAEDSVALLHTIAGADRLTTAAPRIAALCGHLPLALSVAGAWLLRHPATPAEDLAVRLADESRRLDLLGVDDLDVRASLSLSVDQLVRSRRAVDPQAATALQLLSLSDNEDFTGVTAAPLLDVSPATADRLLERLTDLHLLESGAPGRYHFHDLVRAFARERAEQIPAVDRDAALDRSLAFYLGAAWRAAELAVPTSARMAWPGRPPAPLVPQFATPDEAMGWIDGEFRNYLPLMEQTGTRDDRDERIAGLVVGMFDYFARQGNLTDWLPAIDRAAAGRIERWTYAQLQADAAIALAELARYEESAQRFGLARDAFESIGDLRGVSLTGNNKARLLVRMRRHQEALPLVEEALAINKQLGNDRALGSSYAALIEIQTELGDWNGAEASAQASGELGQRVGDALMVANVRIDGAWARVRSGRPETAIDDLLLSLAELEKLGLRKHTSDAHWVLGLTYLRLNAVESALEHAEQALEIALDVRDPRREAQIRHLLGELLVQLGELDEAVPNLEFALDFLRDHDPVAAEEVEKLLLTARAGRGT